MNTFAAAESWLKEEEGKQLNVDNIERPNTKWVFVKFSNIDVKVVLDRQPMLGTGLLPDWLRNLARGGAGPTTTLDNYNDNLCLWRCIAVHQGTRTDRCTRAAKDLAKRYFGLDNIPRTGLYQLDPIERYLNMYQNKPVSEWLDIRVYEPEQQENGEIQWW